MTEKKPARRCAKASVVLRPRSSRFVELFRTTPAETVCPNFYVLAHASGCSFAPQCRYCYLKSSFWQLQKPEAFTNIDRMLADVSRWIDRDNLETYLLNSGNLSDSLVFEEERPVVGQLVELFRTRAATKRHTLLLLTKGGMKHCKVLFEREATNRVVVSFSVNSTEAAAKHEAGAATPADRLLAAKTLIERKWRVRMRIDPMIAGFDYGETIEAVRELRPERITLGTLRAEKSLPRFAEEGLFDLLEPSAKPGGMARYPRALRMEMYRKAVERLRDVAPLGLCEETPDVWDELGLDKDAKSCNCGE